MMRFMFDVDGTLTPSRGQMDAKFEAFFEMFATHNACYLVTGSDREKTLEQIPETIYNLCARVYQCSGNHTFEQNRQVYKNNWSIDYKVVMWLMDQLDKSKFELKTGHHLDERAGLANFSIVGRKCDRFQRRRYVTYDMETGERQTIADKFNVKFFKDGLVATVAGETGIDITPVGCGKDQVLRDFEDPSHIVFFGDKTMPGGNDHDIAKALVEVGGTVYPVNDWNDTLRYLQNLETVV